MVAVQNWHRLGKTGLTNTGERGLVALEAYSDGRHVKAGLKNGFQQFPGMLESAPLLGLHRGEQAPAGAPLELATASVAIQVRQGERIGGPLAGIALENPQDQRRQVLVALFGLARAGLGPCTARCLGRCAP